MSSDPGAPSCRYFEKGRCNLGYSCRFKHILLDEDDVPVELGAGDVVIEPMGEYSRSDDEGFIYSKYTFPEANSSQILRFKTAATYKKSRLTIGVTHVVYDANFPVNNGHIADLLACPEVLADLEVLKIKGFSSPIIVKPRKRDKMKDTEASTPAPQFIPITDEPLISVIEASPNLRAIELIGCINLTTGVFETILKGCPDIEYIRITGIPGTLGKITTDCLIYLYLNDGEPGSQLFEIDLRNQDISGETYARTSKIRPTIAFTAGIQEATTDINSDKGIYSMAFGHICVKDGEPLMVKECFEPRWEDKKITDWESNDQTLAVKSGGMDSDASGSRSSAASTTPDIFIRDNKLFISDTEFARAQPRQPAYRPDVEGITKMLDKYIGKRPPHKEEESGKFT